MKTPPAARSTTARWFSTSRVTFRCSRRTVKNGVLDGEYSSRRGTPLPIHAVRALPQPHRRSKPPTFPAFGNLEGVTAGNTTRRLATGSSAEGLRGFRRDSPRGRRYRTLTGSYRDGKFVLSHFSGARPALVEITPQPDGTLAVDLKGSTTRV